jgi:hypothetical protein
LSNTIFIGEKQIYAGGDMAAPSDPAANKGPNGLWSATTAHIRTNNGVPPSMLGYSIAPTPPNITPVAVADSGTSGSHVNEWINGDGGWLLLSLDSSYNVFRPVLVRMPVAEIDTRPAVVNMPGIARKDKWRFRSFTSSPLTANQALATGRGLMAFGSWHAGINNFVSGDGAVHGINNNISERTLAKLGVVDNGNNVPSIPK